AVTSEADRAAARERLGMPAATRLLLTIGTSYKYESGDRHLLDVLEPLVAADPSMLLVAAGPEPNGRWAAAAAATGGRVLAAGILPDLTDLLRAADVLVEAYPCSSGTAAVEAAQTGLPVVAWAPDAVEADLLGSAGAAAGLWPVCADAAELQELLLALTADPAARRAAGDAARAAVEEHHCPERWRAALDMAQTAARELGPVARDELAPPPADVTATDLVLHHLHERTGHCQPMEVVDRWVAQAEALAAWPLVELCFVPSLAGRSTHLELVRCFDVAVADPAAGEEGAAVDALRTLVQAGIAARGVVALAPERVAEALPALEAALAAGTEVDLDVTPTPDPDALLVPGCLAVRTPSDRFTGTPAHALRAG
ncbi:MAG TPA: glycosyltransferase family 4 protein, partial [Baekduia sp.]|nr:glycosyltransferase family 4 protein [Baekduia sp.]